MLSNAVTLLLGNIGHTTASTAEDTGNNCDDGVMYPSTAKVWEIGL